MNHCVSRRFALCMSAILLLTACQPKSKTVLPVTGAQEISLSARMDQTRERVLGHILSSSRLASIPPLADWQLDTSEPAETEYRYRSGDWLMLIRFAGTGEEDHQVLIINQVEKASWLGYVTPDGQVIDTTYGR